MSPSLSPGFEGDKGTKPIETHTGHTSDCQGFPWSEHQQRGTTGLETIPLNSYQTLWFLKHGRRDTAGPSCLSPLAAPAQPPCGSLSDVEAGSGWEREGVQARLIGGCHLVPMATAAELSLSG